MIDYFRHKLIEEMIRALSLGSREQFLPITCTPSDIHLRKARMNLHISKKMCVIATIIGEKEVSRMVGVGGP
jgi:hypothetical protein